MKTPWYREPDRLISALLAAVGAGGVGFAYILQRVFAVTPCALCYYERVPYVLAAGLGLFGLLMPITPARRRIVVLCAAFVFAVGAGLALYHVGVENAWWAGTPACTSDTLADRMSLSDMQAALSTRARARCDDVSWTLFGFSLAALNLAASAGLCLICTMLAAEHRLWRVRRFRPRP